MSSASFAKSVCAQGVLLLTAGLFQGKRYLISFLTFELFLPLNSFRACCVKCKTKGFTMVPELGANPKLALTAHYKTILHALLAIGVGAAAAAGSFPAMGRISANIAFYTIVVGSWISFYADVNASFIGIHLPLAAKNAGATVDEDHINSVLIKVSALFVSIGMLVLCTRLSSSTLVGLGSGAASSGKKAN